MARSSPVGRQGSPPKETWARTDKSRKARNHIRQLEALGYTVTITQAA
jgi:hypothetical protein